eukprot:CAMPEP_0113725332 /NCGR_PEP_ID=MMETSP0038_2-20120614/39672_1 /TAXON_ID=2898 /ORGANISM="Cryptomonas paramecium" /LENGTH=409 /DNA_ID=CAMNT_0000655525 /DNA_START=9 /DNA_END=1238 /DNA_ORIENTATION=- /assembly_acc=CAM_ASM_000170
MTDQVQVLKQLLQIPANKRCADCGERCPRFASVTFGVFLCNRCFGVHRVGFLVRMFHIFFNNLNQGLGTHISRTRSVHLDKWSDEQLQAMKSIGNEKAARIWEATLEESCRVAPDAHDSVREEFIRDKYIRKRFCVESSPDGNNAQTTPAAQPASPLNPPKAAASQAPAPTTTDAAPPISRTPSSVISPAMALPPPPPSTRRAHAAAATTTTTTAAPQQHAPLADLFQPAPASQASPATQAPTPLDDPFGLLSLSSHPAAPAAAPPAQATSTATSTAASTAAALPPHRLDNAAIMSLFGPPKAGGAAAMGPPMMPGFGPGAAPRTGPTGHSFFGPPAAAGGGGGFGVGFPMAAGFGVGAAPLGGGFAGTGFGGQQAPWPAFPAVAAAATAAPSFAGLSSKARDPFASLL